MTTDRFRLDGRTVLVTGGAGFLGQTMGSRAARPPAQR